MNSGRKRFCEMYFRTILSLRDFFNVHTIALIRIVGDSYGLGHFSQSRACNEFDIHDGCVINFDVVLLTFSRSSYRLVPWV